MAKKKPAPKAAAPTKKKAPKKAGRPAPNARKIVPNDYEEISRQWGRGKTYQQIADHFGVAANSIASHLKNNILPMLQASHTRSLEAELLKIDQLEKVAWECFWSDEPSEMRELVKKGVSEISASGKSKRQNLEKVLEKQLTKVHRKKLKAFLDVVEWCIEIRCRLEGHFAAVKVRVQHEEYRVAGQKPGEGMTVMMQRIAEIVQNKREQEARLAESGMSSRGSYTPSSN